MMAKLPNPFDLLRRSGSDAGRFTQDAFRISRGVESPEAPHRWWFGKPEAAESFGPINNLDPMSIVSGEKFLQEGTATIPGKLDTSGFVSVDAKGSPWSAIRLQDIKNSEVQQYLLHKLEPDLNPMSKIAGEVHVTLDDIARAANNLNLPGVHARNVWDSGTNVTDQFYVADTRRRRSRFAKFSNPDAHDLLGSAGGLALGGTAAATALNSGRET
jgi:hypothetical protein